MFTTPLSRQCGRALAGSRCRPSAFCEWLVGLNRALFRADSVRGAQRAMAASSCMVPCIHHVLERHGAQVVHHPGTNGGISQVPAAGAGILFIAISICRIGMAHHAAMEDGFRHPASGSCALSLFVHPEARGFGAERSAVCWQHWRCSKCIGPSSLEPATEDDKFWGDVRLTGIESHCQPARRRGRIPRT
jgi:hypothetical protein